MCLTEVLGGIATFLAASMLDDFSSSVKVALVVTLATDLVAVVPSTILPSFKIFSEWKREKLTLFFESAAVVPSWEFIPASSLPLFSVMHYL